MSRAPATPPIDFADIQGIVRFGYAALTECRFLLVGIRDAHAARAWLGGNSVTSAVALDKPPATALQVAFTRAGLEAIGLAPEALAGFSPEFLSGMAGQESRSRRLGDVGTSAPGYWHWGADDSPHLLVMVYAQPGRLDSWTQSLLGAQWSAGFEVLATLNTSELFGAEPFGFRDGISQPTLDWELERHAAGDQLEYSNLVSLGEFLLGYVNEYGKYTDRPLLPSDPLADRHLPPADDAPGMRDLGRNGTYLVVRQLAQDVRGFWRFMADNASDASSRDALAEAMVGRRRNGDPLVVSGSQQIAGIDARNTAQNSFTYESDGDGIRCPLGAHIRRANPRNADLPPNSSELGDRLLHTLGFKNPGLRDDVIASTRFHRLLRRGREYGPAFSPEEALSDAVDPGEHGIHFICVVANILRQFEFVQSAWMMRTKFDALTEESDPLLGNREPVPGCPFTNTFSLPQASGVRRRLAGLPQFVTVRGGAYFFLPSLSALRYLAALDTL